jgi:hypothetical protein
MAHKPMNTRRQMSRRLLSLIGWLIASKNDDGILIMG